MEEKAEAQKDFMAQWMNMQESFWKEWSALGQKMLSATPSGPGQRGTAYSDAFKAFKHYFDWVNLWYKAMALPSFPQTPSAWPNLTEMYENWMKWWQGEKGPVGPGTWYEEFTRRLKKTFGEKAGEGLGLAVFKRITSSAEIYFDVLDFWAKMLSASPDIAAGKPLTEGQVKELHDQCMRNYRSLMESAKWGQPSTIHLNRGAA